MSSHSVNGCVPATAARMPSGSSTAASPVRSSHSSAVASATVVCGTVASSSAEPCVSATVRPCMSSGSASSTSSERESSPHARGSSSITSSSTPIVHGASRPASFQSDQCGAHAARTIVRWP